jgi:hypothetical protein
MNAWQRFARQRLARSRWNSDPAALDPADTQAFEQAWQRQCHMEQTIVARVPEGDIPAALLENIAASLAVWLDEGNLRRPSALPSCCITPGWNSPLPISPARRRSRISPRYRPGICATRRSLCARNSV